MVRVRFAPSPTGNPHVGNLRTAIINWMFAKHHDGSFIARLEDTDRSPERYKPEAIWDLEESMRYLGIMPDEWWLNPGALGPYIQSERLDIYREEIDYLIESGSAYPCFCTREELEAKRKTNPNQGYDKTCRKLSRLDVQQKMSSGMPYVVRLAIPEGKTIVSDLVRGEIEYDNASIDDQVLLKSDGFPTYFLAASADDISMGITHIIRGDDWLSSAAKLVIIWDAMGVKKDCQPKFIHLPLIVGADRAKLSKRHGSTTFKEFIDEGYLPEALFNYLILLGWSTGSENKEILTVNEAIERFDVRNIQESPAMFDYDKLKAMNGHYIRSSPIGRIIALTEARLRSVGTISGELSDDQRTMLRQAVTLEAPRSRTIAELAENVKFYFRSPWQSLVFAFDTKLAEKYLSKVTKALVNKLVDEIEGFIEPWKHDPINTFLRDFSERTGISFKLLAQIVRIAITGRDVSPPLMEMMEIIGKDECIKRLDALTPKLD